MASNRKSIKRKLFLSTSDKDDIQRVRNTEDYELSTAGKYGKFPTYDPEIVLRSFTERDENVNQKFFAKTWEKMKQNIIGQTLWIVIIYLIFYYLFQIMFVQAGINTLSILGQNVTNTSEAFKSCSKLPNITLDDTLERCVGAHRFARFVSSWEKKQAGITKLLTFFLGFYVSQIMGRWWKQVTANPSMENICLALNGIVYSTTESKERILENEIRFKQKIARYCLLSWTMCFSNFSQSLKEKFNDEKAYISKGLMTEEEYNTIASGKPSEDGKLDGWIDKWALPLTWASQLVNQNFQKKGDKEVPKDTKEIIVPLNVFQNDLLKIVTTFENRLPKIQTQAVQFAVWVFIGLGVIAGQQTSNRFDVYQLGWGVLVINFPFIELVKYALIIGWMKVAIYLQNPFGKDKGYDIDMVSYLEVEIWKAACITTQGDPPVA